MPVATIINSGAGVVGPVIDGYTVPQQPVTALTASQFNQRFASSGDQNHALRLGVLPLLQYLRALWPRYETGQPLVLSLKTQPTVITDFATEHQCALWKSLGYPEALISSVP